MGSAKAMWLPSGSVIMTVLTEKSAASLPFKVWGLLCQHVVCLWRCMQLLLSLGAECDAVNAKAQTPCDVCITHTARTLLENRHTSAAQAKMEVTGSVAVF